MKRALRKARYRKQKQKAIITKNLIKNHICDNCDHIKKIDWGYDKKEIGQSWCSNLLHKHLYRTSKIPKENTCRLWSENMSMKVNWNSSNNLFVVAGSPTRTITLPQVQLGRSIRITNGSSDSITINSK